MKKITKALVIIFLGFITVLALILIFFGHRDIPIQKLKAKYATPPSLFMTLNGMEVHYRDEGNTQGEIPIVLIHGTGASLHTFDIWTEYLKKDYRVIRMDLPAYGLTGPFPNSNYSIEHYVEFIETFLSSLEIEHCIIAGNSLGGAIAWNVALKHPNLVDKLVLINSSGYPSKAKSVPIAFKIAKLRPVNQIFTFITPRFMAKASLNNVYVDRSKISKELVDRYFELSLREGNRQAFIDRIGIKGDTTAYKNISSIQQRTLILWGEQDELIPLINATRFHDDLKNDTLVIINGSGHVPMEECPEQSVKALISFLNSK